MVLKEFTKDNPSCFNVERLQYFKSINYTCESHGKPLLVSDGYKLTNSDIKYSYEQKFIKENPHSIWCYESYKKPKGFQSEESKLVYCKACENNRRKS